MASLFIGSASFISSARIAQELGTAEPTHEDISRLLKYLISVEPSVWMNLLIRGDNNSKRSQETEQQQRSKQGQPEQEQVGSDYTSSITQYFRLYLWCLLSIDEVIEAQNLLNKIRATVGDRSWLSVFDPFDDVIISAKRLYEFEHAKKLWHALSMVDKLSSEEEDEKATAATTTAKIETTATETTTKETTATETMTTETIRSLKAYGARHLFERMYKFVTKVFTEINLTTLVGYLGVDPSKYETAHDLLNELRVIDPGWNLNEDTNIFTVPASLGVSTEALNETEKHQLSVLVDYATFLTNKGIFDKM